MQVSYEDLKKTNASFMTELSQVAQRTIKKGHYVLGDELDKFEKSFAAFNEAKYCVGVASGLDALRLSLMALDIPPHSEVIVSANSYIATILAVIQAGHIPVLIEPRLIDGNLDSSKVEKAITSSTKAILPVHCYGKACDMNKLCEIAEKYQLALIEDCAQAHGATYKDKKVGTFGDIGAFSFYPTKNLGALGDGGAIITDSEAIYQKILSLRNYGEIRKYSNQYIGLNSRLDEIQAAFLNVKLPYLNTINQYKRKLAAIYYEKLNKDFHVPPQEPIAPSVYHIFNLRHPKRDELQAFLLKLGVKTAVHYPTPPYRQQAYQQHLSGKFPVSDEWHATTLSLPISFGHTEDEIEYVAQCVNEFNL